MELPQAHQFREFAQLSLHIINVSDVVDVDDGAQLECFLVFEGWGVVGSEHDVLSFQSHCSELDISNLQSGE